MAGLHSFFLSSFFLACLLSPSAAYARFIAHRCSADSDSSSFRTALIDAFSDLASSSSASRSHRSIRASGESEIHASYHCWRSIPSQLACNRCVESATKSMLRLCPGRQNGTVWNSECTLHYFTTSHDAKPLSTYIEDGNQENAPWAWWYSLSKIDEVTSRAKFDEALDEIMSSLIDKVTNSTQRLYATGEVMVTILDTLYGTVECGQSESQSTCRACLRAAMARVPGSCGGSRAAEVILPSCRLGYDVGPSISRASLVGPFSSSSFANTVPKSLAKR